MTAPIGVLFVHGIGEQTESESVRWFAGSLIRWLDEWYKARPAVGDRPEILNSHLSYGVSEMEGPARVEVRLPRYASRKRGAFAESRWIIAEGWWAARISPPGLGEMIGWAIRSTGRALSRLWQQAAFRWWLIGLRVTGRSDRRLGRSDPGLIGALIELLSTTLLLILYAATTPVLYAIVAVLWLITLIPIPAIRETAFTKLIEPFLVEGLGDFKTYVEDDIQALHIRERLANDVRWLVDNEHCSDLIVVAHSHGTVVAFDALTSGTLPHIDKIRKFITVGAALNNAWQLHPDAKRMAGTLPSHIFWLDFYAYYDPVPGGQLDRSTGRTLVDPDRALQARMSWYEKFVHRDEGANADAPPTSAMPRECTNNMNVTTDHDGYWRNPEQFLSRLAAEIDAPGDSYKKSRFHLSKIWQRTLLRRRRVTTLVGWRLLAMVAFVAAVVGRSVQHGIARLEADGQVIADAVSAVPGAEVLSSPAAVADGLRKWLESIAMAPIGVIADLARALASFLGADAWSPLWHVLLAVVAFGGIFIVLYRLLVHFLWRPWDDAEGRASVKPLPDEVNQRWVGRSAVTLVLLAAFATVVAL